MAGMPVRLHGIVKRLAIERGAMLNGPPGSNVRPMRGATSGTVGPSTTSTRWKAFGEVLLHERAHLLAVQVLSGAHEQPALDALQDVGAVILGSFAQPRRMPGGGLAGHDGGAGNLRMAGVRQRDLFDLSTKLLERRDCFPHQPLHVGLEHLEEVLAGNAQA